MPSFFYTRLTSVFLLPTLLVAAFSSAFPDLVSGQGCGCTNCPQFMPDNFVGDFTINVSGADNPTLGQNGQGVCGVNIHFDHEYLGDLRITLTSPSGQTVTLVGPIGFFGPTDGSSWNVSFVPCNGNPVPDPGFSAQWNNNQNWGLNGTYTGSYFPQIGCLENFNSGPVDGTWTLTVTDGQAQDVGNFYDYEIIFCDPSGIECFSCAADAGNLPQPDVTACQHSPNLDLNLSPTYTAPNTAPPAGEYSYTYVIGGAGGVIVGYEPGPNLQGYDPGSYTVCGLSYYTNHASDIPDPNGSLTIAQLSNQLNSGTPPFCGHITDNCVNVNILARPDDIEEDVEICFPACYTFFNVSYCQTGTYVRNLSTPQGCQYTATLRLTVHQPNTTNLTEFICEGGCATTEGFEDVCAPGIYQNYYQNQFGCDSIVRLNVQVLNVVATANPTGQISCTNPQVQISGIGSSTGANVTYQWTASNGGNIVGSPNGINVLVNAAGDYTLEVCRTGAGVTCCTSTMVTLVDNSTPPPAPASISGPAQVCAGDTVTYIAAEVPIATSYVWTVLAEANIIGNNMGSSIQVVWSGGGAGQVCVASNNVCGTSPAVCMAVTAIPTPVAAALFGASTACPGDTVFYIVSNAVPTSSYAWNINGGDFVSQNSGAAVQVVWNSGVPTGLICAVASNACAAAPESCMNVSLSVPGAGPIVEQCDPTNTYYTVSFSITGGTSPYIVSGGIVSNGVFLSYPIVSGETFTFAISDTNYCVSAPISGVFNCSCSTRSGDVSLVPLWACEGQPVAVHYLGGEVLDANDVSSFVLHNGAGTVIVPPIFGQNTTGEFGFVAGMNYGQTYYISRVAGNNLAGFPNPNDPCLSVSQGQPVVFYENPIAMAGADFNTCGLSLLLGGNAGPGLGTWSVVDAPNGANLNINSINNPLSPATASAYGTYLLTWSLDNNGCTDSDTLTLRFNDSPSIANFLAVCDGTNEHFSVSFDVMGGTPDFDVQGLPNGMLTGTTFQSVPIPNGGSYAYTVIDVNGCASEPLSGAFSCNCSTQAGNMSTDLLAACEGGSVSAQYLGGEVLDANDVGAYILHNQSGSFLGQIFAQNTTGTFSFQNGMSYGTTYYISYVVGNDLAGLPDLNDPCLSVSLGQPVIFYQNPVAQAGTDLNTCGTQLSLNANSPAGSSGQWSVSSAPTGGSLMFDDPLSPSTGVTANVYGTYTLTWVLLQNGCIGADQVLLQFNESPLLADLTRLCDATNENFQVELTISGGAVPYTVNGELIAGSTFTSGSFANGATYAFNVSDNNGCSMPTVSGAFSCNCTTSAGTMSAQMLELCGGSVATAVTSGNVVLDPNDVSSYVLHSGAGPALGQVIAQNTTGTFAFDPGQMNFGTTYYISLVAGNALAGFPDPADPCFSVAPGQPVRWLQSPEPNVGPDFSVCGLSANLQVEPSPYPGLWSLVSGPGAVDFTAPSSLNCPVNVGTAGTYTFRWTTQNGICDGSDELTVTVNPLPAIDMLTETCDGTNTTFQVSFTATIGQAPYTVSGLAGVFSGNIFTSDPLLSTSTYAFVLYDDNGCESPIVIGTQNCDCGTDAGTMSNTLAVFCEDTPAVGVWDSNAVTDANDIVRFILHDSPGANVGNTVFAVNTQPVFDFGPNLQLGVTYYISAIAGNNNGGSVDLNDPCLSVAPGTPVHWKPLPHVNISGDATICSGGNAVLSFSGTGTYPLTLNYDAGSVASMLPLTGPQTVTLNVSPTSTTSYVLKEVIDGTLPACASSLSDAVTVMVNQPVSAGTPLPDLELCFGTGQTISLASLLVGAQPGGQWSEVSAVPSQGGAFNAALGTFQPNGQPAATYSFRYRLMAPPPCADDEATVSVTVRPRPIADAGTDKTLNCNAVTALIGGVNTSSGEYRWLFNSDTVSVERQLLAKEGGTYTLLVTNALGCTATDQVVVTEDKEVPLATSVLHNDVRCFGEQNGSISIESVASSRPPVLYSLNGGPFGASPLFNRLSPGDYMVTLQDAIGCESEVGPITVGQPPQLMVDLGEDISLQLADSAHLDLQTSVPWHTLASIEWQPLLDPSAAGKPYQNFLPLHSWEVLVTVKDSAGCTATDHLLVHLQKPRKVFIPNVFSPDKSIIPFLGVYGGRDVELVETFQIFDRWGELVFEKRNFLPNDDSFAWDGRVKGQIASPGVFVYYAKVRFIDGETVLFTGDVTVLR